jgi:hypothetical protein
MFTMFTVNAMNAVEHRFRNVHDKSSKDRGPALPAVAKSA